MNEVQRGDKGDPFTYEDFTPEQLEALTGPPGSDGAKGDKGDKGDPGEDGFPTEAQWNALVARVEALEEPKE